MDLGNRKTHLSGISGDIVVGSDDSMLVALEWSADWTQQGFSEFQLIVCLSGHSRQTPLETLVWEHSGAIISQTDTYFPKEMEETQHGAKRETTGLKLIR